MLVLGTVLVILPILWGLVYLIQEEGWQVVCNLILPILVASTSIAVGAKLINIYYGV